MTARRGAHPSRPRFSFFGGKGGVGKTTCAAAAAVRAAEEGHQVLVASTDPAHSLGDALRSALGHEPRRVATQRGRLDAVELDADGALDEWLDERSSVLRLIAERGTYLDGEDVDQLFGLSLPGVDELVGLLHLVNVSERRPYDLVVVDMAPTGHALRMLEMPETLRRLAVVLDDMQAKHRYMAEALGGRRRSDRADALIGELEAEARLLYDLLRDPARCTFSWVLAAEMLALAEARRGMRDLHQRGIRVGEVIINRSSDVPSKGCPSCTARARDEVEALSRVRQDLEVPVLRLVADLGREPRGLTALRTVGRQLARRAQGPAPPLPGHRSRARARPERRERRATPAGRTASGPLSHRKTSPHAARRDRRSTPGPRSLAACAPWAAHLAPPGRRLLILAGKGGVGKTTCAATVGLVLSALEPDRRVFLLSADPAHSLSDVLGVSVGDEATPVVGAAPSLRVRELDSHQALERTRGTYRHEVEALFDRFFKGSRLDATLDRAVMHDLIELTPPGMDEVFAVLAVVNALHGEEGPEADLVVLDAAPTGHALRLLAMPDLVQQWIHAILRTLLKYREALGLGDAAAHLLEQARQVRSLLELLHDPARCAVVAVTRPAELPRLETLRLLEALDELGISVGSLIVNATTHGNCDGCQRATGRERRAVRALGAACGALRDVPWGLIEAPRVYPPPVGPAALSRWATSWKEGSA